MCESLWNKRIDSDDLYYRNILPEYVMIYSTVVFCCNLKQFWYLQHVKTPEL